MPIISLTVNGSPVSEDIASNTLLVEFIRDRLNLTGTHVGCDTSQCGVCTVLLDGAPIKSCTMLAVQAEGSDITTIEGLAPNDTDLHPMQEAFREHHGLQCGFCTPGMVLTAVAFAKENPNADEADIRHELEGNLCRCTGYQNIVDAVKAGSKTMQEAG
jgi:carbon-monoxide dehydrogenase small subunit